MKPICIFRHIECEGPGYLAEVLERSAIPWQLVAVDRGEPIPERVDGYAGLVFMGGPMSVNDDLDWIRRELDLIRQAAGQDMPVLGHCLGGQLISKALGGRIGPNPVKEIGWLDVEQVVSAAAEDWLASLPERFPVFHWHGETFSIPDGASLILSSDHCPHQGFVRGNILALQCHVEVTAEQVPEWSTLYADELIPSPTIQSTAEMSRDLDTRLARLHAVAQRLYARWLAGVKQALPAQA